MNKYTRMNWENTPSTATPLTADNLNHMDEGIEQATDGAIALETEITTARGDSADLNTRFTADEASLAAVKSEIATARDGQNSLGARLDTVDANLAKKANKSDIDSINSRLQSAETVLKNKANIADVSNSLASKANKSTTLAGYGISDAYTKNAVDTSLANKANLVNSSNIFDFDAWAKGLQGLTAPIYNGTLNNVDYNEKSISFTTTENIGYTSGWANSEASQSMRIAVKPNTKYLFSWLPSSTKSGAYVFLNGINTAATRFALTSGFGSFTTVEDTTYIKIRFDYYGIGFLKVSEIMITEKESIYLPNKVAEGVPEVANEVLAFEKTTQASLDSKYDSSNIELGTATLTPYSTQIDKIKSATCLYEKIGDIVIVNVTVIMNATSLGGTSAISLLNMPFSNKSDVIVHDIGISKNGGMFRGSVTQSTWLQFTPLNKQAYNFVADEQVNFSLIYKI